METYGKILLVAMPAFLLLVLIEKFYGYYRGNDTVRNMDMISSLSSGFTNVIKDVLGISVAIIGYSWMVEHLAIVHIKANWLVYLVAFLALDFSGYWVHRIAHEYNFFWNNHIVHHSSEEFNLACALRQSISVFVRIFTFFLLPAALLGVPGQVIAIVAPIQLFAQFWYHTRHIGHMGFLEKIIVTPSHHRVHHAINPQYLDKNYSQIFIWWDRWFGTFQQELPEVPPVYGITRPVQTWNPVKINFLHLWLLIKDAWRAEDFKDKLRIWFMPTGWRPLDVEKKYPVHKINDVYHFDKYDTKASLGLHIWSWLQLLAMLVLTSYLFAHIAEIHRANTYQIYIYGLILFIDVYAYTELMDRNPTAWIAEGLKCILGLYIIWIQGDWFLSDRFGVWIKYAVAIYLVGSLLVTLYFVVKHNKEDSAPVKSLSIH
ncbi:MAG: sterol desaturase family protein [Saprospiraceae bacterium]|jgi:sterol desaturase/sphingolipid hydroxylase (fatty acid hydroxylase superfamily)|nr:sterol desaturase family protein [Saprospiraceae bacterium]MBK6478618.1 sterol desaturase family protein [Saprospiraceae bacterium]MBK6814112.1 sterol desaturase family protein [Saprospiraceae bacterium]MBK7373549.1 sterol desaturase family protein [Saprospiraceae bacterium]MBK7437223.1 sterol desaturase family protein [Saprospiraceae bacterium]